jgi:hypothetical protein
VIGRSNHDVNLDGQINARALATQIVFPPCWATMFLSQVAMNPANVDQSHQFDARTTVTNLSCLTFLIGLVNMTGEVFDD